MTTDVTGHTLDVDGVRKLLGMAAYTKRRVRVEGNGTQGERKVLKPTTHYRCPFENCPLIFHCKKMYVQHLVSAKPVGHGVGRKELLTLRPKESGVLVSLPPQVGSKRGSEEGEEGGEIEGAVTERLLCCGFKEKGVVCKRTCARWCKLKDHFLTHLASSNLPLHEKHNFIYTYFNPRFNKLNLHLFQCALCKESFNSTKVLSRHASLAHKGGAGAVVVAVVEERGVEEGRGVVEHRDAEREGNGEFREEVLERVVEGAPARSKPLARPRSEAPSYSCPFTDCIRKFSQWSKFKEHYCTHHPYTVKHTIFSYLTPYVDSLISKKLFVCTKCNEPFVDKQTFTVHQKKCAVQGAAGREREFSGSVSVVAARRDARDEGVAGNIEAKEKRKMERPPHWLIDGEWEEEEVRTVSSASRGAAERGGVVVVVEPQPQLKEKMERKERGTEDEVRVGVVPDERGGGEGVAVVEPEPPIAVKDERKEEKQAQRWVGIEQRPRARLGRGIEKGERRMTGR